ncbi:MAG TPA: GNAT family N-acetyltransferase [Spirochaetia bacterium]|nr:GNAT family N-acetyltransferase [Spirochaetia bacterium]
MKLSRLVPSDFDKAVSFWRHAQGMGTSGIETAEILTSFLRHNPSLSFKITDRDTIVGTILCGHDGRRGYVHHLAVESAYLTQNVGKTLIDRSLEGLNRLGIKKCHIFISASNKGGQEFWKSIDWSEQGDLTVFSHDIEYPTS